MNYGFAFDCETEAPYLTGDYQDERYCAHLYHAVAMQVDLIGKRVLDIGSGRGGGTSHVHRHFVPTATVGLDLAKSAVEFCRETHGHIDRLEFVTGSAMDLPFDDDSFEAVLNVESSHCYPDRRVFFENVFRVTRPGGHFLYADFFDPSDRAESELKETGFRVQKQKNITQNVLRALHFDNARRETGVKTHFPRGVQWAARLWAGTTGSWVYRDFQSGTREYVMYCAVKPE